MTLQEKETMAAVKRVATKLAGVDWEQRRYEIAREALAAILSNPNVFKAYGEHFCTTIAKSAHTLAVQAADNLINELKANSL